MNNFTSMVIAILEHVGVLTEEEARKLVKELHGSTLPDNYAGASRFVKDLFNKHEVATISSKVVSTAQLEKEVETLKAQVEGLKSVKPVEKKVVASIK